MRSLMWKVVLGSGIVLAVPSIGLGETKMILDKPDQSFSKLVNDSGTLAFNGVVTIDPLTPITAYGIDQAFPVGNHSTPLTPVYTDGFENFLKDAFAGSTEPEKFVGTIFTIQIDHSTLPGVYDRSSADSFGGVPPTVYFMSPADPGSCDDPFGCFTTTSAQYSVNVIGQKLEAVPEPFTCALGLMGVGAYVRRRRRTR